MAGGTAAGLAMLAAAGGPMASRKFPSPSRTASGRRCLEPRENSSPRDPRLYRKNFPGVAEAAS